jgi:hypothetical protein
VTTAGELQEALMKKEVKDVSEIGAVSKANLTRRDVLVGGAALVATIGFRSTAIATRLDSAGISASHKLNSGENE